MIVDIGNQLNLFFTAIFIGSFCGIYFDIFRILRKSIKHSTFFINLEDLLFWIVTTFGFYYIFLHKNNGELRGYILGGFVIGFLLEFLIFSRVFIKIGVKFVTFLAKIFKEIFNFLLQPITFLCKMVSSIVRPFLSKSKKVVIEKYTATKIHKKRKFKGDKDF